MKRIFLVLLLLFLSQGSYAQDTTFWLYEDVFPILNSEDSIYKRVIKQVAQNLHYSIKKTKIALFWHNPFEVSQGVDEQIQNFEEIDYVGDSLLYLKVNWTDGKFIYLIYRKWQQDLDELSIQNFEHVYYKRTGNYIIKTLYDNEKIELQQVSKNMYQTIPSNGKQDTTLYLISTQNDKLAVKRLGLKNERYKFGALSALAQNMGVILDEYYTSPSDILLQLANTAKYSVFYLPHKQRQVSTIAHPIYVSYAECTFPDYNPPSWGNTQSWGGTGDDDFNNFLVKQDSFFTKETIYEDGTILLSNQGSYQRYYSLKEWHDSLLIFEPKQLGLGALKFYKKVDSTMIDIQTFVNDSTFFVNKRDFMVEIKDVFDNSTYYQGVHLWGNLYEVHKDHYGYWKSLALVKQYDNVLCIELVAISNAIAQQLLRDYPLADIVYPEFFKSLSKSRTLIIFK